MRKQLEQIKKEIDLATNQPIYAVAAKALHAERAVVVSYDLLSELVSRVEALEDAEH